METNDVLVFNDPIYGFIITKSKFDTFFYRHPKLAYVMWAYTTEHQMILINSILLSNFFIFLFLAQLSIADWYHLNVRNVTFIYNMHEIQSIYIVLISIHNMPSRNEFIHENLL